MSIIESIGSIFVNWITNDVVPYMAATWDLLVFVLSVGLNIAMLVIFKKRKMFLEPYNRLVFTLIFMDILSWIFVLIPGAITSIRKQYDFTDYFCFPQAVATTWIYLQMFAMITILIVERAVKITNEKRYKKVFGTHGKVKFLIVFVSLLNMGISAIPVYIAGWVDIEYEFYHASCVATYKNNTMYTAILFFLGIGVSFLTSLVCFPIIFSARKALLAIEDKENAKREAALKKINNLNFNSSGTKKEGWTDPSKSNSNSRRGSVASPTTGGGKSGVVKRDKKVFEDDANDPLFHLSITYLIMWCIVLALWLPYFVILFYDISTPEELWGGWYSVGIMIAVTSFCIKPIIYISHNRHFQEHTKEALPEVVIEKANKVRQSISEAVNKLDKLVFKSAIAKPTIKATVTAKILGNRWMNKLKAKKAAGGGGGTFGAFGKKTTTTPTTALTTPADSTPKVGLLGAFGKKTTTTPAENNPKPATLQIISEEPVNTTEKQHERPSGSGDNINSRNRNQARDSLDDNDSRNGNQTRHSPDDNDGQNRNKSQNSKQSRDFYNDNNYQNRNQSRDSYNDNDSPNRNQSRDSYNDYDSQNRNQSRDSYNDYDSQNRNPSRDSFNDYDSQNRNQSRDTYNDYDSQNRNGNQTRGLYNDSQYGNQTRGSNNDLNGQSRNQTQDTQNNYNMDMLRRFV